MEQKSIFPTLTQGFAPTTSAAVAEFERSRGVQLPPAYKQFLMAANGGMPDRSVFPIDGMPLNPSGAIHFFFGLNTGEENYDLAQIYDFFHGDLPAEIIPIACDEGSYYVCLDLRGGSDVVRFWDMSHHWGTGEWREEDLYHVANSFQEFLASLRPNVFPDNDP